MTVNTECCPAVVNFTRLWQAYIYNELQRQSAVLAYLEIITVIAIMCGLIEPLVFLLCRLILGVGLAAISPILTDTLRAR